MNSGSVYDVAQVSVAYRWVPWTTNTPIPDRAVLARGPNSFYVSRICHKGEYIVGQAQLPINKCYVTYDGRVIEYTQCEVLTGTGFAWVKHSGGALPHNAFPVGRKANGDPLYIGRVDHNCAANDEHSGRPGTIDCNTRVMTIAFDSGDFKYHKYDVLVRQQWSPACQLSTS